MRRTEVLQGIRQMKFEEVYERTARSRLSQAEAASLLGMSERTACRAARGQFRSGSSGEAAHGRQAPLHKPR